MTLATRCTSCGTIFRVVQDQLRVSNGWVRCGRCGEAFNAVDSMVDLPPPRATMPVDERPDPVPSPEAVEVQTPAPAPAAPAGPPTPEPPAPVASDQAPTAQVAPEATPAVDLQVPPGPAESHAALPLIELPPGVELIASDGGVGEMADVPRPALEPSPAEPPADVRQGPGTPQDAAPAAAGGVEPPAPTVSAAGIGPDAAPATPVAAAPEPAIDTDQHAPSFVLAADRAARWRRPGVRLALALGVLVALLGLAGQISHVFRDRLAAQAPPLRPWLQRACAALDCRVGDLRQIDVLSVESSGLVRVEGTAVYRLSVTLRNRASFDVAAPALDLSLTDAQGQLFARRVLTMADLDLPLRTLKAGSELPIQVPLGIKDRAVSGYTVEVFYP